MLEIVGIILWPVKNQNQCACHSVWKKGQCLGVINCSFFFWAVQEALAFSFEFVLLQMFWT